MKTIRIAMNIILPQESDDLKEAFANHPQIEVKETGEYSNDLFFEDPIYELTSDETSLRDWILTKYDSEISDEEMKVIFSS